MKTRKASCLFRIITSLALSLVILLLIVYLSIPFVVTSAVGIAGKALGIEMELDSFALNIPEESVEMEDFYLSNPEGYDTKSKALSFNKLHLDVDSPFTNYLTKDLVDVEKLVVDGFSVTFEATSLQALLLNDNNITAILSKLASEEAKAQKEDSGELKVIIRNMSFKNGSIKVIVSGLKMDIALPDFEVSNIGTKEGGISCLAASIKILSAISTQSISAITKQTTTSLVDFGSSVKGVVTPVGGAINQLVEGAGSIFDGF